MGCARGSHCDGSRSLDVVQKKQGATHIRLDMPLLDVVIPHGVGEHEYLAIDAGDGRVLEVEVPAGFKPGDTMQVTFDEASCSPGPQQQHYPSSELLHVTVPDGISEGHTFTVETDWGDCFDIVCPAGSGPGSLVVVELPPPPPSPHPSCPPSPMPPPSAPASPFRDPPVDEDTFHRRGGRRRGERSSREVPAGNVSSYSDRRRHRVSREVPADMVTTRHDGPRVPGHRRTDSRDSSSGGQQQHHHRRSDSHGSDFGGGGSVVAPTPVTATVPADALMDDGSSDWHRYRPHTRVNVLRSDGSYSQATVISSYEGVFEVLYQVRLDNGAMKQAVPEGEMFSLSDASDSNFGMHLQAAMEAMMEADMLDCDMGRCSCDDD